MNIAYPKGETIKDQVIGEYQVYKDKTVVTVVIQRPEGAGPLEVSAAVHYFNFRRGVCFPPQQFKFTVP